MDSSPLDQSAPAWVSEAADRGWLWVAQNWQRAASVPGAWFDEAKAEAAVAQFPKWFSFSILQFAGVPFVLAFWQACIVRLLFGWKRPAETIDPRSGQRRIVQVRIFRELRLWVPRKNGKTDFLAALALMVWYYDGLVGAEGYVFARDENQARVCFNRMKLMIGASADDLNRSIRCHADQLWCQQLVSSFFLITAKAEGKHGRAPYVTIGDEMHEWRGRDLADNLRQGEGPYLQPLRMYASTAGLNSETVGREIYEESEQLLDGRIDDPSVLVAIFAASQDDDWRDEKIWLKANPNLGISPTIDHLRQELAKAHTPAAEAKFRCYHLNQWMDVFQRWLPIKKWDACCEDQNEWLRWWDEGTFEGREVHLAFDATKSFDFAALCLRVKPIEKDEPPRYLWKCWLPAETIAQRTEQEKVRFDRMRDKGAIEEIPGGTFQLSYAIKAVREIAARYEVLKIGWDSWNAVEFYNRLVAPPADDDVRALPEDLFAEMRFGTRSLGEATKAFERHVIEGSCRHGGHPVARYMARHCHVRYDENDNYVPAKKKTGKSIDLIQTAVMTEALAIAKAEAGGYITGKVAIL